MNIAQFCFTLFDLKFACGSLPCWLFCVIIVQQVNVNSYSDFMTYSFSGVLSIAISILVFLFFSLQ